MRNLFRKLKGIYTEFRDEIHWLIFFILIVGTTYWIFSIPNNHWVWNWEVRV